MAIETSFLLIESGWSCERVYRLVDGVPTRWVVIQRSDRGSDLYYLFKRNTVLKRVPANGSTPVGLLLRLEETEAAPTAIADTGNVDRPTVIVNRRLVVGIVRPVILEETGFEWRAAQTAVQVERAVEASAPPRVALGDTVPLIVKLVSTSLDAAVWLTGSIGEEINVVLQAFGGVEIEDKSYDTLKIVEGGTPMLLFKIAGKAIGPGQVSVLVFQKGQGVGCVDVAIETVAQVSHGDPIAAITTLQPAPAQRPDLQLVVTESGRGAGVTYTMFFSTADAALPTFGPFTFSLRQDPRTFFDDFYADIDEILRSSATAQQKLYRLGVKGKYLFDQLMPPAAQVNLWDLRRRIRSVHVVSEEPWVPWELLKPSGDGGDGPIIEAGFLCEDYEFTRWVRGRAYRHDLTMRHIGVVVPSDSRLAASRFEREAMLALRTPQREVTPIDAEEVTLTKVLAGGTLDVVHFTGHGMAVAASADRAEIQLEAGSRLRPESLCGPVKYLGHRSPIVFLNACEIGRAGMGLTRPGGWPCGFLDVGAGAFIGPFWKIGDASAAAFATSFYQELIGGASVGAAALTARRSIQAASDPTWLAYSVYAHCDARLSD